MATILRNCAFIHIPRTSSTWVRCCIKKLGLSYKNSGHGNHNPASIHAPMHACWDEVKDKEYIFSFVRNPVTFLQSMWVKRPKMFTSTLDFDIYDCRDWEQFVDDYIRDGKPCIGKYYHRFLLLKGCVVNKLHALPMETNPESLIAMLSTAGENLDSRMQEAIRNEPPRQVGARDLSDEVKYTREQLFDLLRVERDVLEEYSYPTTPEYYKEYLI